MSPTEIKTSAKDVRSQYAFLFSTVAELSTLHYGGDRPSTRFDDIVALTERMNDDGYLSEYLYASLTVLYKLYPSMAPESKQPPKSLDDLHKLLGIAIGDVCEEISSLIDESNKAHLNSIIRKLLG